MAWKGRTAFCTLYAQKGQSAFPPGKSDADTCYSLNRTPHKHCICLPLQEEPHSTPALLPKSCAFPRTIWSDRLNQESQTLHAVVYSVSLLLSQNSCELCSLQRLLFSLAARVNPVILLKLPGAMSAWGNQRQTTSILVNLASLRKRWGWVSYSWVQG